MEHFGGFWGRLFDFAEIGRFVELWVCGRKRERERFGLLTGDGLDKDLFNGLLIPISTQRAFLYIYMYIKKSQFPLLPYLPVSSSSSNKQHHHHRKES